MDHTKVEGVVSASLRTAASRRWPSLERATPCGVPFSKSSSRDWVQRWVPCACAVRKAAARAGKVNAKRRRRSERTVSSILPLSLLKLAPREHQPDQASARWPFVSQASSHLCQVEERQGCTSSRAVTLTLNLEPAVCRRCSSLASSSSIESLGTNSQT